MIVCGGTGFYIQNIVQPQPYTQIPINLDLRVELESKDKDELRVLMQQKLIPKDFKVDFSSRKRIIRAIEICTYLEEDPNMILNAKSNYHYKILGLNPPVELRRERISKRLKQRLDEGMIDEVRSLIERGVSYGDLEYYGLEYKYISYFLKGEMIYEEFFTKLETEIHRYAKRQMTYFRKMEKDSIAINWI